MVRSLLRASLWLALIPSALLSLVALSSGLSAELWQLDKPFYPAFMVFIVLFPFVIAYGLVQTKSGQSRRELAIWAFGVWALVVLYVAFVFGWMPAVVYRGWEELI